MHKVDHVRTIKPTDYIAVFYYTRAKRKAVIATVGATFLMERFNGVA